MRLSSNFLMIVSGIIISLFHATSSQALNLNFSKAQPARLAAPSCDLDGDGDVDSVDIGDVINCMDGPVNPPPIDCEDADVNGDGHVDLLDFADCQAEFTGPQLRFY